MTPVVSVPGVHTEIAEWLRRSGRNRFIRDGALPPLDGNVRDLEHELTAQGPTREGALDALDDVVEAVHEDGGHEPTDEEIRELGVDPETATTQGDDLPDVLDGD